MQAAEEYHRRSSEQRHRAAVLQRQDLRLGIAKLTLVFVFLVVAWLGLARHWFSTLWLIVPVLALAALFLAHDRVIRARRGAERLLAFYERGLARLEDRWSGLGPAGERFRDSGHAYAEDLDLFGPGSLFQLLCNARTAIGEERLAAWMLAPASPAEVSRRQARVRELTSKLELREAVVSLGDEFQHHLEPQRLRAWSAEPLQCASGWARAGFLGLGAAALATLLYGLGTEQLVPFLAVAALEAVVLVRLRNRLESTLRRRGADGEGMRLFAGVLAHIPEPTPKLADAITVLRRLATLADWIEACDTFLGRILDFVVLYRVQLAYAADAWRLRYGRRVAGWLEAVAEFEALLSLSCLAFERPDNPFPEFVDGAEPVFQGEALGHPLLPLATCVRNSVALDVGMRLMIVSGSNMSGKTTLLRTVGVNAVLAQMGAPVCARRLRLTPLAVGTRIRTADSLQLGRSGFYAEILRLRQIVELAARGLPLLYLFDELLEGTNSHDRVVGARGLLRALLSTSALGLVTTHDLALTAIVADFDGVVRNVHFEDQIEGNDVSFDHHLREGVVSKSNALALMRIIGLEV